MSITWENTPQTQEFSVVPIINQKVKTAAQGLQKSVQNYFLEFPTEKDKELVANFILTCSQQENVAIKTKRVYLIALTYLSRYLKNEKSFEAITAEDLSAYLNSLYKDQTQDPNQSWISTQRTRGLALLKFFK
jgi:Phage integrase, N-terminal SAM-like domain